MDFVRLGAAYSSAYIPDKLIEGYNSLIWHERFQEPGEFELKTFDVERVSALLPEDTLVSHLETKEVMQVETRSIEMVGAGVDARPQLTIKGRSATIILNHRWVEAYYQEKRSMRQAYSATAAACVLMYNAVDNNSGKDVTRGDPDPEMGWADADDPPPPEHNDFPWTTLDDIPNVIVTEAVASEGAAKEFYLEQGPLLSQLTPILLDGGLGMRCLRPVLPNSTTVITVDTPLATRGTIRRTITPNVGALQFQVYAGLDRSSTVQLSMLQGHILEPQYLTSNQEWKTVVELMAGIELADVYRPGESGLSGWQRKTMGYDAGSPEIPPAPERPEPPGENATAAQILAYKKKVDKWKIKMGKWHTKRDAILTKFRTGSASRALTELNKQRKMNLFAGDISDLSPYKYKVHYDLGDAVMLFGDYGKTAKMIVNEYIRTEDATGDRGFPGLRAP